MKKFETIKESGDSEKINDFLIDLGRDPKKEYLKILDFFIEKRDPDIFNKIKLNLIFILGELGGLIEIDKKYIEFLIEEYFISDRWIRNEIVCAFNKIGNKMQFPRKVLDILKYAIIDDYLPIAINGMKSLLHFENLSDDLFENLFKTLKVQDSELIDQIFKVINKFIINEAVLFEKLITLDNYRNLDKKSIRSLLILFFNSVIRLHNLKSFRELVENSEWENKDKEKFLAEIDVYEKLLLKRI
ncbi:MAG: hypothetical protein EU532_11195 [Promethearchaeota archaeon]|nr:MAG: hypothetical protein EU532_11195 [Candidatus Lokiarchaeota archaeon]